MRIITLILILGIIILALGLFSLNPNLVKITGFALPGLDDGDDDKAYCGDNTLIDECSSVLPYYCNLDRQLVQRCDVCGCPEDRKFCNYIYGVCNSPVDLSSCPSGTPLKECFDFDDPDLCNTIDCKAIGEIVNKDRTTADVYSLLRELGNNLELRETPTAQTVFYGYLLDFKEPEEPVLKLLQPTLQELQQNIPTAEEKPEIVIEKLQRSPTGEEIITTEDPDIIVIKGISPASKTRPLLSPGDAEEFKIFLSTDEAGQPQLGLDLGSVM